MAEIHSLNKKLRAIKTKEAAKHTDDTEDNEDNKYNEDNGYSEYNEDNEYNKNYMNSELDRLLDEAGVDTTGKKLEAIKKVAKVCLIILYIDMLILLSDYHKRTILPIYFS